MHILHTPCTVSFDRTSPWALNVMIGDVECVQLQHVGHSFSLIFCVVMFLKLFMSHLIEVAEDERQRKEKKVKEQFCFVKMHFVSLKSE